MKKVIFPVRIILVCFLLMLIVSVAYASSTGTVTASSLNMRKSASTDSKVVCVLKEGNKVTITGTSGNWYKIKYGSNTGYVMKKYISTKSTSSSSGSSSSSKVSTSSTLKSGSSGKEVKNLQTKLKNLGFYSGKINGEYNQATVNAVKKFQKSKGLTADGVAGPATLKAINNAKAGDSSSKSSSGSYTTEKINWFNGGTNKIPKRVTFKVKDCLTGKVFTARRWSGVNHIDAEPYTASDTKIMKSIYGHWSWRRRPVLILYNGHVYAGSMNGMPHGTQTISNNNFDGHFCIHFTGSKTHGSKKVDQMHQDAVKKALKYTW